MGLFRRAHRHGPLGPWPAGPGSCIACPGAVPARSVLPLVGLPMVERAPLSLSARVGSPPPRTLAGASTAVSPREPAVAVQTSVPVHGRTPAASQPRPRPRAARRVRTAFALGRGWQRRNLRGRADPRKSARRHTSRWVRRWPWCWSYGDGAKHPGAPPSISPSRLMRSRTYQQTARVARSGTGDRGRRWVRPSEIAPASIRSRSHYPRSVPGGCPDWSR